MARAREHLNSIAEQVRSLETWSEPELAVVRDRLEAIDRALPSVGDFVCKHCSERVIVEIRRSISTRDGGNPHCARSSTGHDPEFV